MKIRTGRTIDDVRDIGRQAKDNLYLVEQLYH